METAQKPRMTLTPEAVRAIEEIIHRRNQVELKVEQGQIVVIEIQRKKRV